MLPKERKQSYSSPRHSSLPEAVLAGGKRKRRRRVMMGPIDANADLEPDAEDDSGACVYLEECSGAEVRAARLTLVFADGEPGYVVFFCVWGGRC